jgi:hypothetical protein
LAKATISPQLQCSRVRVGDSTIVCEPTQPSGLQTLTYNSIRRYRVNSRPVIAAVEFTPRPIASAPPIHTSADEGPPSGGGGDSLEGSRRRRRSFLHPPKHPLVCFVHLHLVAVSFDNANRRRRTGQTLKSLIVGSEAVQTAEGPAATASRMDKLSATLGLTKLHNCSGGCCLLSQQRSQSPGSIADRSRRRVAFVRGSDPEMHAPSCVPLR